MTILLVVVAFSAIQIIAFAHETISGIESSIDFSKWKLYESGSGTNTNHNSGNGMYIVCDPSLISYGTSWGSYVDSAVNAWNSIEFNGNYIFSGNLVRPSNDTYTLTNSDILNEKTLVTIVGFSDPCSNNWGTTYFVGDSGKNIPAATKYSNSSGGYHLKTITIGLNMSNLNSKTDKNKKYTITHELGHVIGLADLSTDFSDNTNSDCLMGYSNYNLTAPQPRDIKGAAVISGKHTNHSFGTCYSIINETQHRNVCPLCYGYKTENHTISLGKCIYCDEIITDRLYSFDFNIGMRNDTKRTSEVTKSNSDSYAVITINSGTISGTNNITFCVKNGATSATITDSHYTTGYEDFGLTYLEGMGNYGSRCYLEGKSGYYSATAGGKWNA